MRYSIKENKSVYAPTEYFITGVQVQFDGTRNIYKVIKDYNLYDCRQNKSTLLDYLRFLNNQKSKGE